MRARLALLAGSAALGLLAAVPALAVQDGQVTATINLAPPPTTSVTVSPATIVYSDCTDDQGNSTDMLLAPPNGRCTSDAPITVTNGTTTAQIYVAGSSATPQANGGTEPWTLCGGPGAPCGQSNSQGSNNVTPPGSDQFQEETHQQSQGVNVTENPGVVLTNSEQCDLAFDEPSSPGCQAVANQTQTEGLALVGPAESTDSSTTFTTGITWTAVAG